MNWTQRSKPRGLQAVVRTHRPLSKALNGCGVRAAAAAAGGGAKVNPLIPSIGKAIVYSTPDQQRERDQVPSGSDAFPNTLHVTRKSVSCVVSKGSTGSGPRRTTSILPFWRGGPFTIIQYFFFVTAILKGQNGGRLQLLGE